MWVFMNISVHACIFRSTYTHQLPKHAVKKVNIHKSIGFPYTHTHTENIYIYIYIYIYTNTLATKAYAYKCKLDMRRKGKRQKNSLINTRRDRHRQLTPVGQPQKLTWK